MVECTVSSTKRGIELKPQSAATQNNARTTKGLIGTAFAWFPGVFLTNEYFPLEGFEYCADKGRARDGTRQGGRSVSHPTSAPGSGMRGAGADIF